MEYRNGEGTDFKTKLTEIIAVFNIDRILFVIGKTSFEHSGAKVVCDSVFKKKEVAVFNAFSPNPQLSDIQQGITFFRRFNPDVVVAIGGGSAIDTAKAINILAAHDDKPELYVTGEKKLSKKGGMLIAVPTTAGTGSEVTHFAAIYVGLKKYSLAHPFMSPDRMIVDPKLTYSMSPYLTASTGMDALAQAIESHWSITSTDESKAYAREAVLLIMGNLVKAVQVGDKRARAAMSRAAHLAGKAINISKTTASHAMSYPLTTHFGISHGHAVGLTLPELLRYNSGVTKDDVVDHRGVKYVRQTMKEVHSLLGVLNSKDASGVLRSLMRNIQLEVKLSRLGVEEDDFETILGEISEERAGNNPRRFTKESGWAILSKIR